MLMLLPVIYLSAAENMALL